MKHFSLAENILVKMKEVENELGVHHDVLYLKPEELDSWEMRGIELINKQNIPPLIESIDNVGCLQPIIVVKHYGPYKCQHNQHFPYIIIDGYRRFLACKSLGLPIPAIVKNIAIEKAVDFLLLESRDKRFSDYAKGMLYFTILKKKLLEPDKLCEKVKISIPRLNRLLSYAQIPEKLVKEINDLTLVSIKTAETLNQICKNGQDYINALCDIAERIQKGYGEKRIKHLLAEKLDLPFEEESHIKHSIQAHGQVLMETRDNIITLNKELVQNDDYEALIMQLEEVIKNWEDHNH